MPPFCFSCVLDASPLLVISISLSFFPPSLPALYFFRFHWQLISTHTLGWSKTLWKLNVLFQEHSTMSQSGLKTKTSNPKSPAHGCPLVIQRLGKQLSHLLYQDVIKAVWLLACKYPPTSMGWMGQTLDKIILWEIFQMWEILGASFAW